MTHYIDELQKLKKKGIPVHAFYLHKQAKNNFEEIARETNGSCHHLDINTEDGSEILTDIITK
jgi:hypothetical protein